jgi:hypothetical protein
MRDFSALGVGNLDPAVVEQRSGGAIQFNPRFLVGGHC